MCFGPARPPSRNSSNWARISSLPHICDLHVPVIGGHADIFEEIDGLVPPGLDQASPWIKFPLASIKSPRAVSLHDQALRKYTPRQYCLQRCQRSSHDSAPTFASALRTDICSHDTSSPASRPHRSYLPGATPIQVGWRALAAYSRPVHRGCPTRLSALRVRGGLDRVGGA